MPVSQPCARWDCGKSATYEKPLCYDHWLEFVEWELEECNRCHWFFSTDEALFYQDFLDEYPFMCTDCLNMTHFERTGQPAIRGPGPNKRLVAAHAPVERPLRYVYILKLSDAAFYVGQTNNLPARCKEHKEGHQHHTRGKEPRLVYFETFDGMRKAVNEREDKLTVWNQTATGRRRLMEMIEEFRTPLRLLDLEA